MLTLSGMQRQIQERGPRYAVSGRIRRGEYSLTYTADAEAAERMRSYYEEELGIREIRVHPPVGSVDLAALGRDRADAQRLLGERTEILRAAVLRELEAGRAEAEVARSAGVDRMTVRKWAGKR